MKLSNIIYFQSHLFLQRVSIACYAERCISYKSVRPSVRLSVRPSHAGTVSKRLNLRSSGLHRKIPMSKIQKCGFLQLPMFPTEFRGEVNHEETIVMGLSYGKDRMIVA